MRYTWWCQALRSNLGKACDVPGSTEGLFSCFFLSGVGAYLPPIGLHITESASDGTRSWRLRVSSAEDADKLGLGHEGLHVSEVCNNYYEFLRHRNDQEAMQNHTQQSKNADFSSKRTSFDPTLSQTNIVRLKQNAGDWRRPLSLISKIMSLTSNVGFFSNYLNQAFWAPKTKRGHVCAPWKNLFPFIIFSESLSKIESPDTNLVSWKPWLVFKVVHKFRFLTANLHSKIKSLVPLMI